MTGRAVQASFEGRGMGISESRFRILPTHEQALNQDGTDAIVLVVHGGALEADALRDVGSKATVNVLSLRRVPVQ